MTLSRFDAVVFDMDGVLVDGEPLHFRAVNELLSEEGRSLSLEQYKPYMGTKSGWRELVTDLGLSRTPEEYSVRYNELILEQYRRETEPLPGAIELVDALSAARIPLALCSSSRRDWVDTCLEKLGIADRFEAIVSGSEVEHGKPDPEIYLLSAERLNMAPARCLAIEDAPAGIRSATAAGMACWAVRTEYTRDLELPPCERVLESLLEVNLNEIVGVAA